MVIVEVAGLESSQSCNLYSEKKLNDTSGALQARFLQSKYVKKNLSTKVHCISPFAGAVVLPYVL
jgi:prolyl-tRNA editing enzyme YbaK/EbsC (Cys-tRNA(Pro) deacylase)